MMLLMCEFHTVSNVLCACLR